MKDKTINHTIAPEKMMGGRPVEDDPFLLKWSLFSGNMLIFFWGGYWKMKFPFAMAYFQGGMTVSGSVLYFIAFRSLFHKQT